MRKQLILILAGFLFSETTIATTPNWGSEATAEKRATLLSQEGLSLEKAIELALTGDDPYLLEQGDRTGALEDKAVAEAQLPDPQLRLNFANWPVNSFSYTQEPMTQLQLGLSQAFPKGNTLQLNKEKRLAEAEGQRHGQDLRLRSVILDTRLIWLDLYYSNHAYLKTAASRQAVSELIEVIEGMYATGRETSQDILRARLELSLLDDRLLEIKRQADMKRAKLARRIGTAASAPLTPHLPALQHPSEQTALQDMLPNHPVAKVMAAKVKSSDKDVGIAEQSYKPGWAVNVGYGARGGDRADFASVGVVMDVPLFTKNRQDKRLSAAKKTRQASRYTRDTILLNLKKQLHVSYADWQRLGERISLYQTVVLARAKETTAASLTSYQNGVTDFAELVRARLAELDTELKLLRLQIDRLKAQSQLLYLEGEDNA